MGVPVRRRFYAFRATSKRTRIETSCQPCSWDSSPGLSEQHPREQGLKHPGNETRRGLDPSFRATSKRTRIETDGYWFDLTAETSFRATSKRTRIETWCAGSGHQLDAAFQSNIQENKDWNAMCPPDRSFHQKLSEQHPREQGLKLPGSLSWSLARLLSEQHPREQGLKQSYWFAKPDRLIAFRATSKRTRIETWF